MPFTPAPFFRLQSQVQLPTIQVAYEQHHDRQKQRQAEQNQPAVLWVRHEEVDGVHRPVKRSKRGAKAPVTRLRMRQRPRHTKRPARKSRTPKLHRERELDPLDRALQDSFPASDAISFIEPTRQDEPTTRKEPPRASRD